MAVDRQKFIFRFGARVFIRERRLVTRALVPVLCCTCASYSKRCRKAHISRSIWACEVAPALSATQLCCRASKWARTSICKLAQVHTEVAGQSGPMGCAAFPSMTEFLLKTALKMAFPPTSTNIGMWYIRYLPGPGRGRTVASEPPQGAYRSGSGNGVHGLWGISACVPFPSKTAEIECHLLTAPGPGQGHTVYGVGSDEIFACIELRGIIHGIRSGL